MLALFIAIITFLPNNSRVIFRVAEISNSSVVLETNTKCSPGTLVEYETVNGTVTLKLYSKLSDTRYLAVERIDNTMKAKISDLKLGDMAETDPFLSYKIDEKMPDSYYWVSLRNYYFGGNAEWIKLQNGNDLIAGKMPKGKRFLIDAIQPPIGGYVCILSPQDDGKVMVFYPNDRLGTNNEKQFVSFKARYNLTYVLPKDGIPPFANIGLRADPGPTHLVVLVSQSKRPLSDFLPIGHRARYFTHDNKAIQPWEIGPGFYQRGSSYREFSDVDYLPGDSWIIGRLTIEASQ